MEVVDNNSLMVTIHCLVYNHEPYLRQCLDGFVMQKTNFRFEAIVHDDASTDNSAEIIKEYAENYPDIIVPIFEKENQYSKHDGSLDRIMLSHMRGKYMAFCEGDDYWIDPYKLQKQYNIFENDKSIELCYSRSRIYYESTHSFANYLNADKGPTDFESIMFREPAITLTSFIKTDSYKDYWKEIDPSEKEWLMGDTPLFLWLSQKGKVTLLDDITAVYRMLGESASHSSNIDKQIIFNKSARDIRLFFCDKYKRTDLLQKVYDTYYRSNMNDADNNRLFGIFWKNFCKIKNKNIYDFYYLFSHIKHCLFDR